VVWQWSVKLFEIHEKDMNILMLQSDVRRVQKKGIQFTYQGRGGWYIAQELQNYMGQDVRLRYNPEDLESLLVYHADSGEYLCEVGLFGTRGHSRYEVVGWRRGHRRALLERSREYLKETFADDRRSARAQDERLARARAAVAQDRVAPGPELTDSTAPKEAPQVTSLRDLFKSRDRALVGDTPPVG
jgi:hypothetical protein